LLYLVVTLDAMSESVLDMLKKRPERKLGKKTLNERR
jgi:hypothetical protein